MVNGSKPPVPKRPTGGDGNGGVAGGGVLSNGWEGTSHCWQVGQRVAVASTAAPQWGQKCSAGIVADSTSAVRQT
jgi:hypothetical protein